MVLFIRLFSNIFVKFKKVELYYFAASKMLFKCQKAVKIFE